MHAIVSGQISFRAADCHPRVLEQLWQDLTFPNPEYVSRQRMGRAAHGIPETIECIAGAPDVRLDGNSVLPRQCEIDRFGR